MFMLRYLLVLVFVTFSIQKRCGNPEICLCSRVTGIILCSGPNITKFPSFSSEETTSIIFLDIANTSLSDIPSLDDWKDLEMITFTNNAKLKCKDIPKGNDYLHISSDFRNLENPPLRFKPSRESNYFIPLSIAGIFLLLIGNTAFIYLNYPKKRVRNVRRIKLDTIPI